MSRKAAFFDVDDTLIAVKSMFSFQEFSYKRGFVVFGQPYQGEYEDFLRQLHAVAPTGIREDLNRAFYEQFCGRNADETEQIAREWFSELIERQGDKLFIEEGVQLLARYKNLGYRTVAVSGSSVDILAPVVKHLDFDDILATRLAQHGENFTGRIIPPQMIGAGKGRAILDYAARHNLDLPTSIACGDHLSDKTMLDAVGTAFVIAGDPELESLARQRGWTILARHGAADNLAHV